MSDERQPATIDNATNELVALHIPLPANNYKAAAAQFLESAKAIVICSAEQAHAAAADLTRIKALAKEVDGARKELVKPIDEERRKVQDFYKPALDWLAEAESILKRSILAFQREEERRAREAEARRLEQIRKEQAAAAAKAAQLQAAGKIERAEAVLEAAEAKALTMAAPPVVSAPKLAGVSGRKRWRARVIDKAVFLKAIAENPAWIHLADPNEARLDKMAVALESALNIPGVEVYQEEILAARAAK